MLYWGKMCLVLMVIVSVAGAVCAKDTQSLKVSCSIPAVPGLNAPAASTTQVISSETQPMIIQKDVEMRLTSVYAR